ncbi:hypothetical protein Tco_0976775 [Tanacetum coccineum]|uniref:Uncharacterized protein n=1 Tax=Tanacetum coccineum TaxID=301880 RepID=A0ABQ5EIJ6_9ASTR
MQGDSWKLWSVAMQGGGCCGGFGYKEVTKGLLEALELKGGDGGACKLLGRLLGDVIEVLEVLGLEVSSIRRIQVLDTAYWGFLGVGTTLDIFQNIILIPYLEYGVLILSGYGVLIFIPLWSLVSAGTDTPYLP